MTDHADHSHGNRPWAEDGTGETVNERRARVILERKREQQLRHDTLARDPLGHAVLESVEHGWHHRRPYNAQDAARLQAIAGVRVERKPQLWRQGVRVSLGGLVFVGAWQGLQPSPYDGRPWRVQLDDVPADVVPEIVEMKSLAR